MAIFTRKSTPAPLVAQLADKAEELRTRATREAETSKSFIEAARAAQIAAETATERATIVSQAVEILGDAADLD